jgi:hypothetical protein
MACTNFNTCKPLYLPHRKSFPRARIQQNPWRDSNMLLQHFQVRTACQHQYTGAYLNEHQRSPPQQAQSSRIAQLRGDYLHTQPLTIETRIISAPTWLETMQRSLSVCLSASPSLSLPLSLPPQNSPQAHNSMCDVRNSRPPPGVGT